ncbi:hypothetical protein [Actinophytocola sp.]|uniref:hypothetical protein n=1 Tax=Actinophytocola sp. TaxID=1872138 RepID=UPI002D7E56FD|nr:hypothetical protein [Actinophytocola sp.]HET9138141.1 hypothetical protein [Actinophytocola sp.]
MTLLPIADLTAVLHDRDAVLSSEEITALSDHVRRRYSTPDARLASLHPRPRYV